jgi:hypothetical protein
MYGNDFVAQAFKAENGNMAAITDLIARYRFSWTLLMPQDGAVLVFDHLPGWQRVYTDSRAVIHRRIDG